MNMSASTKTGDIVRLMQGGRNFGGDLADMAFYLCNKILFHEKPTPAADQELVLQISSDGDGMSPRDYAMTCMLQIRLA
jgi:hypothetical protein